MFLLDLDEHIYQTHHVGFQDARAKWIVGELCEGPFRFFELFFVGSNIAKYIENPTVENDGFK